MELDIIVRACLPGTGRGRASAHRCQGWGRAQIQTLGGRETTEDGLAALSLSSSGNGGTAAKTGPRGLNPRRAMAQTAGEEGGSQGGAVCAANRAEAVWWWRIWPAELVREAMACAPRRWQRGRVRASKWERDMHRWPSLLEEERGTTGGERAAGGEMRRRPEPACGRAALFLSRGRRRVASKSNRYAHNGWHCG